MSSLDQIPSISVEDKDQPIANNKTMTEPMTVRRDGQRTIVKPDRWPAWVPPVVLICLATLLYYILAQAFQNEIFSSPLQALSSEGANPYLFGLAVQEVLLPLALLVILTTRPIFHRFVSNKGKNFPTQQLVIAFALI
jgi:hypothetical protein